MRQFAARWFGQRAYWLFGLLLVSLLSSVPAYCAPIGANGHIWEVTYRSYSSNWTVQGESPEAACLKYWERYKALHPSGRDGIRWDDMGFQYQEVLDWDPNVWPHWSYACLFGNGVHEINRWAEVYWIDECVAGYFAGEDGSCEPPKVQTCPVSHPVYPGVGVKFLAEQDHLGNEELSLSRTYRSHIFYGANAGQGRWLFEWQQSIDTLAADDRWEPSITVLRKDGDVQKFRKNGNRWGVAGSADTITRKTDKNGRITWFYTFGLSGVVETYDSDGRLQSVQARNGQTTRLSYGKFGQLILVTAPSGRTLQFGYDARGNLITATASDGAVNRYAYNAGGMLVSVTWPDNTSRQYVYEDTRFPTALTGVIDEAGVRYATYAYDDQGRAIISELTGGADRYQFQYGADGQTTVLKPDGGSSVYSFLKQNGVLLPTGVSAPCPSCGKTSFSSEYDTNGNATREVGYDGAATTYAYDTQGRETQRVEAAGTANAKTTTIEWHPTWYLPMRVASPGKLETFAYDDSGNLAAYTSMATADANGGAGFAATPTGLVERTGWTYDGSGHVLTATERTGDTVTGTWTLTYDPQGNLLTLTNPEGKTGRITQYDAAGRVLEAVDVNGIHLKFGYNARGWLTDYDFDGQRIRYEYDAIGQRTAVLGPQDLTTRYVYDAAHRLIEILDNIKLPDADTSEDVSPSPFSFLDRLVQAWNSMIEWLQRWFGGFIASAHARGGAGGMSSYRPSSPMSGESQAKNQSYRPEDVLDPNASSALRPDLRLEVLKAVARVKQACAEVFNRSTPPGDCGDGQYEKMRKEVDDACHPPPGCKGNMSLSQLSLVKEAARRCGIARERINKVCFRGGNATHQIAANETWNAVANCERLMAR